MSDLLESIQLFWSDPQQYLTTLHEISVHDHAYYTEWSTIRDALIARPVLFEIAVNVTRRFSFGLELDGKELWLLHRMLLTVKGSITEVLKEDVSILIETLMRICIEHPVHFVCIDIMQLLLDEDVVDQATLFNKGFGIIEHLPSSISEDNFVDIMNFAMRCIAMNDACFLAATSFLSAIVENVNKASSVNYFLPRMLPPLMAVMEPNHVFNSIESNR